MPPRDQPPRRHSTPKTSAKNGGRSNDRTSGPRSESRPGRGDRPERGGHGGPRRGERGERGAERNSGGRSGRGGSGNTRGNRNSRPERSAENSASSERPARPGQRFDGPRSAKPRPAFGDKPAVKSGPRFGERTGEKRPARRDARGENVRPQKVDKGAWWVPSANAREVRVEVGMDLAHFLVHHSKGKLSVRAARRQLENGCCRINGQVETYGSRQLKYGEIVEFFIAEDNEHTFDPKRLLLDDVGVIAYDKPAYLPVTPTDAIKSWSLLDILTPELGELFPVHRLDADTSGIVLFARSQEIATKLEQLFKDHAVEKTYHAIVRGHPREVGQYRSYLVKKKSQPGFEQWQSGRGPDAREAITHWEVEQRLGHYGSLVRVEPKTGRYHQIRIHFSEMDFPLYGDHLYGDRRDPIHVTRHLLHASRIRLPHPVGGSAIDVRSKLPKDFNDAMMQLRKM
jgi:RluA family pseudouridine synthase